MRGAELSCGHGEVPNLRLRIHNHDTAPADRLEHWNELTKHTRYGDKGMPEVRGERTFEADYSASWFGTTGVVAGAMDGGVFVMDRRRTGHLDSGRVQLALTGSAPQYIDLGDEQREIPPNSLFLQFHDRPRSTLRREHDHMLFVDIDVTRLTIDPGTLRRAHFAALAVDRPVAEMFAQAALGLLQLPRCEPHAADSFLVSLVDLVVRNAFHDELQVSETTPARRAQALRVMRENLSNTDFSAEDLAAALNISRRSLFQLFRTDEAPMSVLRRMRIARAKDILGDPERDSLTMDQIARMCGFSTARGLGVAFRRELGRSPSDFRRIRAAVLDTEYRGEPDTPVVEDYAS
ncbi:putative transcriptional regulator [Nocardia nova SH22a]|uniref:Putative transcriptional regulator n=1 Tax=Nocardia nova SH22a TaxID=1415166 RepID=W5TA82_9NOCA|nr:AraC family transcriptional regulator [Nocardia nova]AHH15873.1 putative transcriptional regulator [Nocardia nova SH22a]